MAKKPKNPNAFEYNGSTIEILSEKTGDQVKVDSKVLHSFRDADTGAYVCDELPYQTFGTLEELGKAYADSDFSE